MKRKLIIGLGIITLLFVTSGLVILKNLHVITTNHKSKEHQEEIIRSYSYILYSLKSAQAELYRHQAGLSRDINALVDYVIQLEDRLLAARNDYSDFANVTSCNNCHSVQENIATLDKTIEKAFSLLTMYKDRISRIMTLSDNELTRSIETEAAKYGDEIIDTISTIRHASLKMNQKMEEFHVTAITRATYSIVIAVVVSVMLSAGILIVVMRSITGPILKLVKGIETVASGEYNSKVDISSHDEIGFLAETFNEMTDSLNRTTQQKESLMLELRDLNSDLERRIEEAKEELRITHENMLRSETLSVVGTFASGVAHELATPLSSIMSYFQMIKGGLAGKDGAAGDIDLIESELRRCRDILRGLLDFARAPEKEKVLVDINGILLGLLTLMNYEPKYRNIKILKDLDMALPQIMAVPGQLKQVFMNLIVNALQAMPEGGELAISTRPEDDGKRVVIEISDTGTGLLESEVNKIFQPFYTSKNSGTGLGLSISYGIVKGHGGDIAVRSEYGKGTTFDVFLPVGNEQPQNAEAAE